MCAEVQTQPQAKTPQPIPNVKVQGAVPLDDVRLPSSNLLAIAAKSENFEPVVGKELAPQYSSRIDVIDTKIKLVREHSHFLTTKQLESYNGILTSSIAEIKTAIESKDKAKLDAALQKLDGKLNILEKFISYEKAQGLAGIHADSGVRIYVKNDKLYLCTPDEKSFSDVLKNPEQKEQLQKFVQAITGIKSIDFAKFQTSVEQNGVKLLSCRLDSISIEEGKKEFKLKTSVRVGNDKFEWKEIGFTLDDLANGALKNVDGFNGSGKIPEVHMKTDSSSARQSERPSELTQLLRTGAASTRPLAASEALVPESLRRFGSRVSQIPEAVMGRINRSRQTAALKTISEAETAIGQVDVGAIATHEAAVAKFDEMSKQARGFHKGVERRLSHLELELKNAAAGSPEEAALKAEVTKLHELADREILLRKEILEKRLGLASTDPEKIAAKKCLVEIKEEVGVAYQRRIDAAPDATAKAPHEAAKTTFDDAVRQFETDLPPGIVAKAKANAAAWLDGHPKLKSTLETVKSWGAVKIQAPSTLKKYWDGFWDKVDARAKGKAAAVLESSEKTLSEVPTESSGLAKQLKSLEADCKVIDRRLADLERRQTKGTVGLDEEIAKLKDRSSEITLKRKEILEKQIAEAGDSPKAANIKAKLYDELGQKVEDAYRNKGQASDADTFAEQRRQHKEQVESDKRNAAFADYPEASKAIKARQAAEKALADAPDGTPLKAERQAALDLANTQEQIAKHKASIQQLEDQLYHSPKDATLKSAVDKAKTDLETLVGEEKTQQRALVERKNATVTSEIAEIDQKLAAGGLDDATVKDLEAKKLKLKADQANYQTELNNQKTQSQSTHEDLKQTEQEIAQKKEDLAKETEASKKAELEKELSQLGEKAKQQQRILLEQEGILAKDSCQKLKASIEELDVKIKSLDPSDPAIKELQASKKQLEGRLKREQVKVEYCEGKIKVLDLETNVANKTQGLESAKKTLSELPDSTPQAGKDAAKAAVETLERELVIATNEMQVAQKAFNSTWSQRFAQARTRFTQLMNTELPGSAYARRNPIKTATVVAVATETIRGVLNADTRDEAKHSVLPSSLLLMPTLINLCGMDYDEWEYTTKELGGAAGARTTEGLHKGASALAMTAEALIAQRALSMTVGKTAFGKAIGQKLMTQAAGKVLVFGGSALDGFLTMSNGQYMHNQSLGEDALMVGSPIAAGAAFGAFFGPVGAGVGAVGGAVGELGGLGYHIWYGMNAELDENYQHRTVRESFRNAQKGLVYAEGKHPPRKALTSTEEEALRVIAIDATTSKFLSFSPSREGLTNEEALEEYKDWKSIREKSGFIVLERGASEAEIQAAAKHNYERTEKLLEEKWAINPGRYIWGNNILQLDEVRQGFASEFKSLYEQTYRDCVKLYNHSMRSTYDSWSDRTRINANHEYHTTVIPKLVESYVSKFKDRELSAKTDEEKGQLAREQWQYITQTFPQFGQIMINEETRNIFLINFNHHLPTGMPKLQDSTFWKYKQHSELGTAVMVNGGMTAEIAAPLLSDLENFNPAGL